VNYNYVYEKIENKFDASQFKSTSQQGFQSYGGRRLTNEGEAFVFFFSFFFLFFKNISLRRDS
jgi:hypothetical protein